MPVLDLFSLDGKVALVTGASRGLGRAMAEGLAEAGADVAVNATNEAGLEPVVRRIRDLGRRALSVTGDLRDLGEVKRIVAAVEAEMGRIDILVNNAGVTKRTPAEEFAVDDWDRVVDVNLRSAFFLAQEVGKRMLKRRYGKIINMASLISFSGGLHITAYAASKGGILQVTKALANEWAGKGINVNAIAPGYFETDLTRPLMEDEKRRGEIDARIPAGRWGRPEDLVGTVVFLASDASSYIHGTVIVVDGGWLAR